MATITKFNSFVEQQLTNRISWDKDLFRVLLTNTEPLITNVVKSEIAGIEGIYGAEGLILQVMLPLIVINGVASLLVLDVVLDASTNVGPFRYAVIYDSSITEPAHPLIAFIDYLSEVTLQAGESFTIKFESARGFGGGEPAGVLFTFQ